MVTPALLLSSAVIAAVAGAVAGYFSQRSLAVRSARLDYEFAARKRLYEALGPLRFQLLVASKDLLRRVAHHPRADRWDLRPHGYYARSFIYRLLRPLAICLLVEREMNYADFSVGKEGLELLRFQAAAYRMLVDEDPLPDYEGLDWGAQSQHVFRDNLRVAASRLIDTGTGDRPSVIDYATFIDRWPDPMADKALSPLARIFNPEHATLAETPVFWVRVVGYAFVCRNLLMEQGRAAGFATPALDVNQLLATVTDEQIRSRVGDYPATFERIIAESL